MAARLIALLLALCSSTAWGQAFDHAHAAWEALLKKHVVLERSGVASSVRYGELAKERGALQAYLRSLSTVKQSEFEAWPRAERMAFLINAYNAFAVEKILTRYPDLRSIWDFGKVFGNPFKDRFFVLLGRPASLDAIEHDMLRKPGAFDEPRIHFAVNCASVGCPMLREEAYVAARLEAQLESQARRFLGDAQRNRFNAATGRLEVSRIFDWFAEDFSPRERFLARYAEHLAPAGAHRELVAQARAPLAFLDYDWSLNDFPSSSRR